MAQVPHPDARVKEVQRPHKIFKRFCERSPIWYRTLHARAYGWESVPFQDGSHLLRRMTDPECVYARWWKGVLYIRDPRMSTSDRAAGASTFLAWFEKSPFYTIEHYRVPPQLLMEPTLLIKWRIEHQLVNVVEAKL